MYNSDHDMNLLEIVSFKNVLSHSRFFLTLRSQTGEYHPLILFKLTPELGQVPSCSNVGSNDTDTVLKKGDSQLYIMEATCPHLGADLSHADIEEHETGIVAVCPWHRYDFDLRTGRSETGLSACTYHVEVKLDPQDGVEKIYMERPRHSSGWKVVELRPVSEAFSDPPCTPSAPLLPIAQGEKSQEDEPVLPLIDPPRTLMQWAVLILNTPKPSLKVQRTRHAVEMLRTGQLSSIGHKSSSAPRPPDVPPREEGFARNTIDPSKMKNRKNRAVMLHALANIEQWAIDLAWDIIARFGPLHHDIPPAFFSDFAKMALDESKHFTLLTTRLAEISPSTPYGSMPVHASLWESATVTSTSLRSRLAIIHLVHEARGLDVNPGTIERFRKAGDTKSVDVMEIIHADEVTHVTTGHRWFTWVCARDGGVDPVKAFREEVRKGWRGDVKGPFNVEDRERAGLSRDFYENLKGEMGFPRTHSGQDDKPEHNQTQTEPINHITVEYKQE